MIGITWIHVAGGVSALLSGAVAVAVRKGGDRHVSAGAWFCVSMFVLGVTASILEPFKTPPESPIGGIMVCYFVATAWMTARRHSGTSGRFEKIACAIVLAIAIAIIGHGFEVAFAPAGKFPTPPGPGVLFALGGICLLAGLGDLQFILRGKLSAIQRISRHLWRMCFALFIATGSFFLGQQKVMPQAVRGSPILLVLALAPIALMLFWLVRVRYSKTIARLEPLDAVTGVLADTRRQD
jgi:hypothetical protein